MPLQYYLMPDVITPDPDDYIAVTSNSRTFTIEDVYDQMTPGELTFMISEPAKENCQVEKRTTKDNSKKVKTGTLPDMLTVSYRVNYLTRTGESSLHVREKYPFTRIIIY